MNVVVGPRETFITRRRSQPTPAGLCTDVVYLVNGVATLMLAPMECTVVIPEPPSVAGPTVYDDVTGDPYDTTEPARSMEQVAHILTGADWRITPPTAGSAWLTMSRN